MKTSCFYVFPDCCFNDANSPNMGLIDEFYSILFYFILSLTWAAFHVSGLEMYKNEWVGLCQRTYTSLSAALCIAPSPGHSEKNKKTKKNPQKTFLKLAHAMLLSKRHSSGEKLRRIGKAI